jgi:hypothetical protein
MATAVILIVFCKKVLSSNKDNDDAMQKCIKSVNKLILNLPKIDSDNINYNNIKEESDKGLMNILMKLGGAIKENCVIAMNQIHATRLAVYLFHNGTKSSHGINFFKASCICEKVAVGSGVKERMIDHNNIPINLFDDMVYKLNSYNRYIIINDENLTNSAHKIFVSADKIDYVQLISIYDNDNNMLGFIAAEMDKSYTKDGADAEKKVLDDLAKQLTPVLSFSEYIDLKQ